MSKGQIKTIGYWAILLCVPFIAFVPYIPFGNLGFSADDILFLAVIAIGLVGLILIWAKGDTIKKKELFPTNVIFPFIALVVASVFSCLYNSRNTADFILMFSKGPVRFLLTLFFIGVIYYYLDSEKRIKNVLLALLAASAVESIFGIGAFLFSWHGPYNIGIATSRNYSVLSGIIGGRVNGTFGSVLKNFTGSNLLASYFVILIPISIAFIMILKKNWQKVLMGAVLLSQSVCLALTYTRTSIVFVFLSTLFFVWIINKKKIIIWMLIAALVFGAFTPGLAERFFYDSTNRLDIWRSAALVAKDYPIWGVGPGKYLDELSGNILRYRVFTFDTEVLTPHNFFLYAWAILGVFGFLAIVWLVYEIGKDLRKRFKYADGDSRILLAGVIASTIGFLMQNFTNNFLFVPVVASYFWVVYVIGIRMLNVKSFSDFWF